MLLYLYIFFVLGEVLVYGEYVIIYVVFDVVNNIVNCSFYVVVIREYCLNYF